MIVVIYGVLFNISCVLGIFFVNLVKLFIVKIILRMYLEKNDGEKSLLLLFRRYFCVIYVFIIDLIFIYIK